MGSWFTAKRDGKCKHCGAPFSAGDDVYAKGAGVYLGGDCGCGHVAESEPVIAGPRETAVMRDLAKLPEEAAQTMIAANMIGMAKQLDDGDVAPREIPNFTKELRLNLMSLLDAYPAGEDDDETEEARRKRERRAREAGGY
jgi:hypothetical protein